MTSDWGPPPPPPTSGGASEWAPPQASAPPAAGIEVAIQPERPSYLFPALTGGVLAGLLAAFGACICGFLSGPLGGALAAWGVRRRTASFGYREGAYAGFLASLVAVVVFAGIYVPMTIANFKRIQSEGLNDAERRAVQVAPWMSEQSFLDSAAIGASTPGLVVVTVLNGGLLFFMSVLGGAGVGLAFPRVLQGWTGPPPPPATGYNHPYGPPAGVPEPYAAPGFDEEAPAPEAEPEPRYSTAWKEVSPEELAKPITLEDDETAPSGEPLSDEGSSESEPPQG